MKFILCLLCSSALVYTAIVYAGDTVLGKKIVTAWYANEDLAYQIHDAKTKLVEEYIGEVCAKIDVVDNQAGEPRNWLDGIKTAPRDFSRSAIRSDPEGVLRQVQCALQRAWTVELTIRGEQKVSSLEISRRAPALMRYRDIYNPDAERFAHQQTKRYADCLARISSARNTAELDSARLASPQTMGLAQPTVLASE